MNVASAHHRQGQPGGGGSRTAEWFGVTKGAKETGAGAARLVETAVGGQIVAPGGYTALGWDTSPAP